MVPKLSAISKNEIPSPAAGAAGKVKVIALDEVLTNIFSPLKTLSVAAVMVRQLDEPLPLEFIVNQLTPLVAKIALPPGGRISEELPPSSYCT